MAWPRSDGHFTPTLLEGALFRCEKRIIDLSRFYNDLYAEYFSHGQLRWQRDGQRLPRSHVGGGRNALAAHFIQPLEQLEWIGIWCDVLTDAAKQLGEKLIIFDHPIRWVFIRSGMIVYFYKRIGVTGNKGYKFDH